MTYDTDALGTTAADHIIKQNSSDGYITSTMFMDTVSDGYNLIHLPSPQLYPKGSIIAFSKPDGGVTLSYESNGSYPDISFYSRQMLPAGQNVYLKLLTVSSIYSNIATITKGFTHSYSSPGEYGLTGKFFCGGTWYTSLRTIYGKKKFPCYRDFEIKSDF